MPSAEACNRRCRSDGDWSFNYVSCLEKEAMDRTCRVDRRCRVVGWADN